MYRTYKKDDIKDSWQWGKNCKRLHVLLLYGILFKEV